MQRLLKGVGSEKDNLIKTKMNREIPKLTFYYVILRVVCVR
jgi:hypothetical protein